MLIFVTMLPYKKHHNVDYYPYIKHFLSGMYISQDFSQCACPLLFHTFYNNYILFLFPLYSNIFTVLPEAVAHVYSLNYYIFSLLPEAVTDVYSLNMDTLLPPWFMSCLS